MSKPTELHVASVDGETQPTFFDTQELRTLGTDGAKQTELLVLSRDAGLVDAVRAAAPSIMRVVSATDVGEVADQPGLDPGVLVVDTAITNDVHAMLPQLLQHFPEIVIIVVGKRDDVSALMRLTASGRIFRFLLVPLAHGQTRLALGAAVAHHFEIRAANVRTGAMPAVVPKRKFPLAYLALGSAVLVAIVGIWWGIGALTRREPAPVAVQPAPATLPVVAEPPPSEVQIQLQLAKAAFDGGNLTEPAGSSALDAYRKALELEPANAAAQAGMRAIADKVLGDAERALTAQRLADAVRGIEFARGIDAANPRLQFLDAQVARERERVKLDQERDQANRRLATLERSLAEAQRARALPANRPSPVVATERVAPTPTGESRSVPSEPATIELPTPSALTQPPPQPTPSNPDQWLQAIELPRTREVAPDYPSQAFINGTEGWVDVDFTITKEGVPENLRVRDSSPRRVFDRAALDSVRQWRFVPLVDNGAAVSRRATLRVRFQRQ